MTAPRDDKFVGDDKEAAAWTKLMQAAPPASPTADQDEEVIMIATGKDYNPNEEE